MVRHLCAQTLHILRIDGSGGGRDVDTEGIDAGPGEPVQTCPQAPVRGGDEQPRPDLGRGQGRIGVPGRLGEFLIARAGNVGDEGRFVELDPVDAGRGERADDLTVDGGELVEAVERTGGGAGSRFGQREQSQRPDEYGADAMTGRFGLSHECEQVLRVRGERGVVGEFGHKVVVVRVEPFRHLQRRRGRGAAGEGEVLREVEVRAVGGRRD